MLSGTDAPPQARRQARKSRVAQHPVGSTIVCDICGDSIRKETRRQKRCVGCRPEYLRRFQRERAGTKVALGEATGCRDCGVRIVKSSPTHVLCDGCRENRRRTKEARRKARLGLEHRTFGAVFICRKCGEAGSRQAPGQRYCPPCSLEVRRERSRARALARAHGRGVQQVKGTVITCEHCGNPFERRGITAKFCGACRPVIWRKCPKRRVDLSIGNAIRKALGARKSGRSWETLVGYTADDLRRHLERQFRPGMSWANYGRWHIDHIVPKSSFSYDSAEDPEFRAAWALTNLRPLWSRDNLAKRDRRLLLI